MEYEVGSIGELQELMKTYEKNEFGGFSFMKLVIFSDLSGQLIKVGFVEEDEEILEFDHIDEMYDFLRQ